MDESDLRREKQGLRSEITACWEATGNSARLAMSNAIAEAVAVLPEWNSADSVLAYLAMADEIDTKVMIQTAWRADKKVYLPRIESGRLAFRLFAPSTADSRDRERRPAEDVSDRQQAVGPQADRTAGNRYTGGRSQPSDGFARAVAALERHPFGMREPPPHAELWRPRGARNENPVSWGPGARNDAAAARTFVICPGRAFDRHGNRLGRGKGFYDTFLAPVREHLFVCAVGAGFQLRDSVPAGPNDVPVDAVVTENGGYRCRSN